MSQPATPRTRVRRLPELGAYDRDTIDPIIDEAIICHLAWIGPDGDPRVIPTIHTRIGDELYVHGSVASSTLRGIKGGAPVAISITLIDGIQFARSMFEHSMSYRTVIVYGKAEEVTDPGELETIFDAITDHVAPGRSKDARRPTPDEIRQTTFVKIPISEASAKISAGFPEDAEGDMDLDVWAGVLPLKLVAGEPEAAPDLKPGVPTPDYVTDWRRPRV
jgi:nitroimidazol reductase NimA-like FMN-containing flavoprotein (pyridoxamine 5'-phosphate oxidase superfamily)